MTQQILLKICLRNNRRKRRQLLLYTRPTPCSYTVTPIPEAI